MVSRTLWARPGIWPARALEGLASPSWLSGPDLGTKKTYIYDAVKQIHVYFFGEPDLGTKQTYIYDSVKQIRVCFFPNQYK